MMPQHVTTNMIQTTVLAVILLSCSVATADPNAEDVAFFEKTIRPVLVERCYECHSATAEMKGELKGGLRLDTRAGLRRGGDSGPAVVPGDLEASLLLPAIKHEDLEMPPDAKLSAAEIAAFETWIRRGAADPRDGQAGQQPGERIDMEAGRQFWAFQPPRNSAPPAVKDTTWPKTAIDRFLLARLEKAGLRPVGDADRYTLLRRLTFDLTGLPPHPADIDAFINDRSPDAWSRVVERLMASPEFGERWGRHWLDVARYADSNGGGVNIAFDNAWRYRDYVIAAFNNDKPYDRFIIEQLAGDLLAHESPQQRAEQITATGFLMVGNKPLAKYDKDELILDVADEQIDTVGRAFMGMTLGCARCHDHKFDPVPTSDYYALAGIFTSTHSIIKGQVISNWPNVPLPLNEQDQPWYSARKKQLGEPLALAAADIQQPRDESIRVRGQSAARGDQVPRGFLQVASLSGPPSIPVDSSGRLELANWLTDPQHPLTARVMVNRVWHHLFGRGLVSSVDNFGMSGARPTHPELLDALAVEFREDGWSIKQLIRRLVNSRAYQMASTGDASLLKQGRAIDPDNDLLWRARGRRLDVEAMRDAILSISGGLDRSRGGPTLTFTGRFEFANDTKVLDVPSPAFRRGVYLPIVRDHLDMVDSLDILEVFDFANPSFVTGRRNATTVPTQALYLMNSPFVTNQSERAARRLLSGPGDDALRVQRFFLESLGRRATKTEVDGAIALLRDVGNDLKGKEQLDIATWTVFCQTIFAASEFVFLN